MLHQRLVKKYICKITIRYSAV